MIKHYEVFIKVVELGSFSKAAKDLYLSQPTVTASIKSIEKELAVTLIDRSYKKLKLTEEGKITYQYAKKIIVNNSKLKDSLKTSMDATEGKLTLYSSTFGKAYLLEKFIPIFLRSYPKISITIDIQSSIEIIDSIKANEITFGIVGDNSDKGLEYKKIATHSLVLITPKGLIKNKKTVSINDIQALPLIKRGIKSSTLKSFNSSLRGQNYNPNDFNYILEIDDLEFIKKMVSNGVGSSIINDSSIKKEDLLKLDVFKITEIDVNREFFIALSKRHKQSHIEKTFLDSFLDYLDKNPSTS